MIIKEISLLLGVSLLLVAGVNKVSSNWHCHHRSVLQPDVCCTVCSVSWSWLAEYLTGWQ